MKFSLYGYLISFFFVLMGGLFIWHLWQRQKFDQLLYSSETTGFKLYVSAIIAGFAVWMSTAVIIHLIIKLSKRKLLENQITSETVWFALPLCLFSGMIGARIERLSAPTPHLQALGINGFSDYLQNPYLIFDISTGGLGLYGGIVGGALGLGWYAWRNKLPFFALSDLATVGLALAQAIGRWGDFFNQELYGRPTTLPWAIPIESQFRLPAFAEFDTFHPLFLYESLWTLGLFFLLNWLIQGWEWPRMRGAITAVYLLGYAFSQLLVEPLRLNQAVLALGNNVQLSVTSWMSLMVIVFALPLLLRYFKSF